jgi:Head domain of trimeric autotransporter adhesin/Chaperone of endosialidase
MKFNTLFKKFTVFLLLLAPHLLLAQVGINSTGAAPSADAMLDVKSTNKGVLIPRLSSSSLIPSPSLGLIFYNTTTNQFNYYNGTIWIAIANSANSTGWTVNGNDIYNSNTGNVGIGTTLPKATFNVADGKTVLFGADSSGSGRKLLWYPSKGAFRVGYSSATNWDYPNVGLNSVAFGYGTIANANTSTAMGHATTASGNYSTALGFNTQALGNYSTAMGNNTTARENYSTAMGYRTIASGYYSTAMGYFTTASGFNSTAIGSYTSASGAHSMAMGYGTTASGYSSTTMGGNTTASGNYSTALGAYNIDDPTALFMVGNGTSSALSNALTVLNDGKVGIGITPKATFNIAAGKTVLFGADSSGSGRKLLWYPSKGAFRVGYSSDTEWDYANVGYFSTAMGYSTTARGYFSTAMGQSTTASGNYSTAMGFNTIASGYSSTTMGFNTTASGDFSTAMGYNTTARGSITTALGYFTTASGFSSTVMGYYTTASGQYSTALGIYNIDVPTALFMVGNGNSSTRSNALTVLNDGKVGIGTTAPIAPLHISIANSVAENNTNRYFSYATGSNIISFSPGTYNVGLLVDYDIVTKNSFVSAQTATTSDARIKNIIGLSNNQQDLDKVRQIQITDYRYKDVHTWGNQTFKKVIAQQVEEVYPQAVRKMTSIIPDIYALADQVIFEAASKHLTILMSKNYDIKVGEIIEFILEKEGKVQGVVASVSGNSFTVKNWQHPTDKIFVFGREVKDFRSVDYEAISMLGISAIQQLAKEHELLLKEIKQLKDDGKELNTRLGIIESLLSNNAKGK